METKKRALVIDDDDDFRSAVGSLLAKEGFEVFDADSGRAGLTQLAAVHPDLVVVDVMMENPAEGYGVTQAIKFQPAFQEFGSVPIIMISSIQETPDELFFRASEAGMVRPDRYLTKPLDVPRFLDVVRAVTRRH